MEASRVSFMKGISILSPTGSSGLLYCWITAVQAEKLTGPERLVLNVVSVLCTESGAGVLEIGIEVPTKRGCHVSLKT